MTRLVALVLLVGCGAPSEPEISLDTGGPEVIGSQGRFVRMGRIDASAVAPDLEGPGGWFTTDVALERVDGDGLPAEHIGLQQLGEGGWTALDRSPWGWLLGDGERVAVLPTDGGPPTQLALEGVPLVGRLTDRARLLVTRADGCHIASFGPDGAISEVPADCEVRGDLGGWTGDTAVRVAVDGARTYALVPGSRSLAVRQGGDPLGTHVLPRRGMAVAARAGVLVVLSDAQVLMHLDADTGQLLAEHVVHRPPDVDSVRLAADGRGLVVSGPGGTAFFEVDLDAPGFVIPDQETPPSVDGDPKKGFGDAAVEQLGSAQNGTSW